MSLSEGELITVMTILRDKCIGAGTRINYFIPTPLFLTGKADVFAQLDPQTTQVDIEETLIYGLWINYLRFEEFDRESDCTGETVFFELALFHESSLDRLDESDAFKTQVLLAPQHHVIDIFRLRTAFKGINELNLSGFAVSEYITLTQPENTAHDVQCDFIEGEVTGSQTKLQTEVRILRT